MIMLHKLGHQAEPFYLAPDLIVTVEANPDTVITLTTGAKLLVVESPETIVGRVRDSRVGVLVDALDQRGQERAGEPWDETPGRTAELAPAAEPEPAAVECG
jgi:flagellar protein FlbD